jgi:hypothetical protein
MGTLHQPRIVRATAPVTEPSVEPPFEPNLVTVPNVELIEVGEDWETSTGVFTWGEDDLISGIESQEDPAVRTPVLKLGHVDPRFDGQPVFGRIMNMALTNNGQTLVGDLVGVPAWLAKVMWAAYPRRSFEGRVQYTTRTGNKWPLVVEALSLLGTAYPAINTLEDLQQMWGDVPPPLYPAEDTDEILASEGSLIRARRVEPVRWRKKNDERTGEVSAAAGDVAQASVSLDEMRMAFYESLGPTQMWWWVRQVLVNPLQLVVDDDEGGLWLVDVTVGSDDTVTFGDPTQVKVEYVAAAKANGIARQGQFIASKFGDAKSAGGRVRSATVPPSQGGTTDPVTEEDTNDMKLTPEALAKIGLPADATEDQINEKLLALSDDSGGEGNPQAQPETPATDPTAQPATGTPTGTPDPVATPGTGQPSTVAPSEGAPAAPAEGAPATGRTTEVPAVPEGMVLVDQDQWSTVQESIAASEAERRQRAAEQRDEFIAAAVKDGKFPRSSMEKYKTMWDNEIKASGNANDTRGLIEQMAKGLIPTTQRGVAAETDPQVKASYPEAWRPARAGTGSMVKVAND